MNYVAYYRVSTTKQDNGIEAQRNECEAWASRGGHTILAEYSERESGAHDSREQLKLAIAHAKREGAVLLVAKLDRLSRKSSTIADLCEQVPFRSIDVPNGGDRCSYQDVAVMAALAETELQLIRERTRKGIAVAREKRGGKWGTPENFTEAGRQAGAAAMHDNALKNDANRKAHLAASGLRAQGKSYAAIAAELNASGYRTPRGCDWAAMSVKRLLAMMA